MGAFADEVRRRVEGARSSLREARAGGDEYLVRVRLGELEELRRTASSHGIELPGLEDDLAASRDADVVELPDGGTPGPAR